MQALLGTLLYLLESIFFKVICLNIQVTNIYHDMKLTVKRVIKKLQQEKPSNTRRETVLKFQKYIGTLLERQCLQWNGLTGLSLQMKQH